MIILPGTNDFIETINALTFFWTNHFNSVMIVRPGNNGLPEEVSLKEAQEYFFDGELDARMKEMNEYDY